MAVYEYYTPTYNAGRVPWNNDYMGQSFTIGTVGPNQAFTLDSITILTRKMKGAPGIHTVKVYAAADNGYPIGSELSTGTFDPNDLVASPTAPAEHNVTMSSVILRRSTKYVFYIIGAENVDSSNYIGVYSYTPGAYTGGTEVTYNVGTGIWATLPDDLYFIINGTVVSCPDWDNQTDCEANSCYWYDSACHTNPYFEGTRDVYASGFTARFQKRQIIGYFPVSGDLRSIVCNASGHLLTDIEVEVSSGLWVDGVSGVHVYVESGVHVVADVNVEVSSGLFVDGISGQHVFVESGVYLASGICPVTADIIKTSPVRVITAASGGEVLYSGVILSLCVKARTANATDIYIGGAAPYRPYSGFGFCLEGGETKCYDVNNFGDVYLCATTSGDKVCFDGASL